MMGSGITRLCDGDNSWLLRRTREIEGAEKVELVCVGGLLRMCGESILLPVWKSVGVGFIGKGELDAWYKKQKTSENRQYKTWRTENLHGMGGECAGMGAILPRVSALSIWWMDTAECRDVVWQRKLFSVVTRKRNISKVSPGLGWY